jgi:hypothetical protein
VNTPLLFRVLNQPDGSEPPTAELAALLEARALPRLSAIWPGRSNYHFVAKAAPTPSRVPNGEPTGSE